MHSEIRQFQHRYGDKIAKNYEKVLSSQLAVEGDDLQGIACPHCGVVGQNEVVYTRNCSEGKRRRRVCLKCEVKFTTYERVLPLDVEAKLKRLEKLERFLMRVQDGLDELAED